MSVSLVSSGMFQKSEASLISTPLYLQIANAVVRKAIAEKLASGEALPSIATLKSQFNTTSQTVQNAYRHLREQNVVRSTRGASMHLTDAKNARRYLKESAETFLRAAIAEYLLLGESASSIRDVAFVQAKKMAR